MFLTNLYYNLRPFVPRAVQIAIRRQIVRRRLPKYAHVWPIDERAGVAPEGWTGWPEGKKFAFVITHDVETTKGVERCRKLAQIDREHGFRSSFNFVAEDYPIPSGLRESLVADGFEIGVHGLIHRGNLYGSRKKFEQDALKINQYLKDWNTTGFRTPSMFHNLEWIQDLNIEYDSSTFDTDPFEPQPDGIGTIFPKWISSNGNGKGYIELPYTLPQDYMLFVVMGERNIGIWKRKIDWIAERGGMALLIVHPDYVTFNSSASIREFPVDFYRQFLSYVRDRYAGKYWAATPKEITRYCMTANIARRAPKLSSRRVVTINPCKDERWDKFVENHPHGWICHLSGWKRVLEASFQHMKGYYLVIEDQGGTILAGLPLWEVRSWLTGNRLVSIPFATLSDPLCSSDGELDDLVNEAIRLCVRINMPMLEIRSVHSQQLSSDSRFIGNYSFKHHFLLLEKDPEQLKKEFSYKSVRYEINRAYKSGLTLSIASNKEDLRAFHLLHTKTRSRLGLPPQPFRFFDALWDSFHPSDRMRLLLAKDGQQLVAGQLYFKFRDRVSMEFEAWDRSRRHTSPNHFLIWEAIKLFHAEGLKVLDFGRTSERNIPLMDFKRRWGTKVMDLPIFLYAQKKYLPLDDREDSLSYRIMRRVCSSAPAWTLDSLGNFCYRHLG